MKLTSILLKTLLYLIFFFGFFAIMLLVGQTKIIPCDISNCEHPIKDYKYCTLYNPQFDEATYCTIKPAILQRNTTPYLIIWIFFIIALPTYLTRKILPRLYNKITNKKF
jgi:hypothetical protein